MTAAISAKGDECIAAYPHMQDAIVVAQREADEYAKRLEEEHRLVKEEEERARKAEEDEVARRTAEAEELSCKTTEAEELARKTAKAMALAHQIFESAQEKETAEEEDGPDGNAEGDESSEAEEEIGDMIVVCQKVSFSFLAFPGSS